MCTKQTGGRTAAFDIWYLYRKPSHLSPCLTLSCPPPGVWLQTYPVFGRGEWGGEGRLPHSWKDKAGQNTGAASGMTSHPVPVLTGRCAHTHRYLKQTREVLVVSQMKMCDLCRGWMRGSIHVQVTCAAGNKAEPPTVFDFWTTDIIFRQGQI